MRDEAPSWDMLLGMVDRSGLTDDEKDAAAWAMRWLRDLLGPSWVRRQYERQGQLPGELLLAASHRYVLPMLLSFVTRLRAVAGVEATFAPVLTELRRGLTSAGWRHLQLQLEVARALRRGGRTVTFEPGIPGSDSKADLRVDQADVSPWLIETTSLSRSQLDRNGEAYEERFRWALRGVELRHGVHCIAYLDEHLDQSATENWVTAVDEAAGRTRVTGQAQTVATAAGQVVVHADAPGTGATTFRGALRSWDGWHRLGRTLRGKAYQSIGPAPVWLRIDGLDGFFQFTEWSTLEWPERIDRLAAALHDELQGVSHLHGVVLSSGPAVSLGAVDPDSENVTAETSRGTGIRRIIVPHLVRETAIVPLRQPAVEQAADWADAYAAEASWLDEDLAQAGQPRVGSF